MPPNHKMSNSISNKCLSIGYKKPQNQPKKKKKSKYPNKTNSNQKNINNTLKNFSLDLHQ